MVFTAEPDNRDDWSRRLGGSAPDTACSRPRIQRAAKSGYHYKDPSAKTEGGIGEGSVILTEPSGECAQAARDHGDGSRLDHARLHPRCTA